ncbi:MAG: hypothetical protein KDD41_05635 [Flavobacteriales bacterium]|nr:hypothetical protein [Flavobacteriales bacterium]
MDYVKFQTLGRKEEATDKVVSYYISKQFSNLFSSYTQAFNKQQKRKGNLFQKGFKRKEVDSPEYLKQLVLYIHCNAVHHRFVSDFIKWKHMSYHTILKDLQAEIIRWFDDLDNFIACHRHQNNFFNIENLIIE